jgi:hypothetical protein
MNQANRLPPSSDFLYNRYRTLMMETELLSESSNFSEYLLQLFLKNMLLKFLQWKKSDTCVTLVRQCELRKALAWILRERRYEYCSCNVRSFVTLKPDAPTSNVNFSRIIQSQSSLYFCFRQKREKLCSPLGNLLRPTLSNIV